MMSNVCSREARKPMAAVASRARQSDLGPGPPHPSIAHGRDGARRNGRVVHGQEEDAFRSGGHGAQAALERTQHATIRMRVYDDAHSRHAGKRGLDWRGVMTQHEHRAAQRIGEQAREARGNRLTPPGQQGFGHTHARGRAAGQNHGGE